MSLTLTQLETAYSCLSQSASDLSSAGRHDEAGSMLRQRSAVQARIALYHAREAVLSAAEDGDIGALDCAMSELRLARTAACTGAAFEAAGSSVQGVRQP